MNKLELFFSILGLVNIFLWLFLMREAWFFQVESEKAKAKKVENEKLFHPKVSVVFAARDEEQYLEQCLRSLAAQTYPNLEVIVVNDRSRDTTPEIIDRVALGSERVQGLHVRELPADWLGKNHALWQGASMATGDYLLFTDGDVIFEPNAIEQSLEWALANQLDHLVLSPRFDSKTSFLSTLQAYFALMFLLFTRPSLAKKSKDHYIGAGAFNLVRRNAYESMGGHKALRMEVVDDVMLGRLMVQGEFRQMALAGDELISLNWYEDSFALHRGLRKNAFAAMGYSVGILMGYISITALLHIVPYLGLFFLDGWGLVTISLSLLLSHLFFIGALVKLKIDWKLFWLLSPSAIFLCTAHIRSTWVCLRSGVVQWRESVYPISELKKFRKEMMNSGSPKN